MVRLNLFLLVFLFSQVVWSKVVWSKTITKILMPTQRIQLPISVSKNISVKGRANINIGYSGGFYTVSAKKPGVSLVSDSKDTYMIVVYPSELYNFANDLNIAMEDMRGPKLSFSRDSPVISGRILHISDLLEFSNISLKHNNNFVLDATFEPEVSNAFKKHLSNYKIKNNLHQIEFVNDKKAYSIDVFGNGELIDNHKRYLSSFGLPVNYNSGKISLSPMIEIQVHITELRRSGFYRFGIGWPSSYVASVLPVEFANKLEVELNALEESGNGSILAKPTLICKSGEEASFFAGGEIPIPIITSRYRQSVQWKPYGVLLKFNPVANQTGEISMDLTAGISSIDSSRAANGIPAMFKNEVKSKFNLKESRTIALSGLLKSSNGKSLNGIPFINKIPILGKLFSSSDYRNDNTKLVILVTPKLVSSI